MTRAVDILMSFGNVSDSQSCRGVTWAVQAWLSTVGSVGSVFATANQLLGHQIKLIDGRKKANTRGSSMAGGRRTAELAAR